MELFGLIMNCWKWKHFLRRPVYVRFQRCQEGHRTHGAEGECQMWGVVEPGLHQQMHHNSKDRSNITLIFYQWFKVSTLRYCKIIIWVTYDMVYNQEAILKTSTNFWPYNLVFLHFCVSNTWNPENSIKLAPFMKLQNLLVYCFWKKTF